MRLLVPSVLLALLVGCGGSDPAPTNATPADSGVSDDAADSGATDAAETGGSGCTSARDTAVGPVDKVSTSVVKVISDTAGVKTVYVDASAGGVSGGKTNPWIYLKLATAARVDVTDVQAFTSTEWDLAFKRPVIHTNSGDAGPGSGGARLVSKAFDSVTAADATTLKTEKWFDADCQPLLDPIGSLKTTFDGWYSYDGATMKVTAKDVTFVVAAANGDLFKVQILDYYGTPTGGSSTTGANYVLKLAALK